jgi:Uma2 family endonuclease
MSTILPPFTTADFTGIEPARLVLRPLLKLDEDQFFQLVAQNPDQPLEQNAQGEVIVMAPTGTFAGESSGDIFLQLGIWNKTEKRGSVFDSSTLFRFANGAARSPDAAFVEQSRCDRLTGKQRKGIARLTPNFVIELRSENDRLVDLQEKLEEYIANGVELGWIIDPLLFQVHIYESGNQFRCWIGLQQSTAPGACRVLCLI